MKCDVCGKIISENEDFKALLIYKTRYDEKYWDECMTDAELEMDCCTDCMDNLNFGGD